MVIIAPIAYLIIVLTILTLKRTWSSLMYLGLAISFAVFFWGIGIYISKTGGISYSERTILFINRNIYNWFESLAITIPNVGYIIAIGRCLFPAFYLNLNINESMIPFFRKHTRVSVFIYILPLLSVIMYFPKVFFTVFGDNISSMIAFAWMIRIWILLYLVLSILLQFIEFGHLKTNFCRKRAIINILFNILMLCPYAINFLQEPIQAYNIYNLKMSWFYGTRYSTITSMYKYLPVILALMAVFMFLALSYLIVAKYTQYRERKANRDYRRMFLSASAGIGVLIHSIKNQLVMIRVLDNKIIENCKGPEKKIIESAEQLQTINDNILEKLDGLYNQINISERQKEIVCHAVDLVKHAVAETKEIFPDAVIMVNGIQNDLIEVNDTKIKDSLCCILQNAIEATKPGRHAEIQCQIFDERKYIVIEIIDKGKGIPESEIKKIIQPFYTTKNSKNNWGVGMYFAYENILQYYGTLRIISKEREGTKVQVIFPKYTGKRTERMLLI